jgi:hypothetical protein
MSLEVRPASQPHEASWDFSQVFDFLNALSHPHPPEDAPNNYEDATYHPGQILPDQRDSFILPAPVDSIDKRKHVSLGNFDTVFQGLHSEPVDIPRPRSTSSEGTSPSDDVSSSDPEPEEYSTSASSSPDAGSEHFEAFIQRQAAEPEDDHYTKHISKIQYHDKGIESSPKLKRTKSKETKRLLTSERKEGKPTLAIVYQNKSSKSTGRRRKIASGFEPEAELPSVTSFFSQNFGEAGNPFLKPATPSAARLTPAWVTPHRADLALQELFSPLDLPSISIDATQISPIEHLTVKEKKGRIVCRLLNNFSDVQNMKQQLINAVQQVGGNHSAQGIHVFVDSSNITIGFYQALKRARGLSVKEYTRRPPISWHSLTLIMERGRSVAKRVVVGSHRSEKRPEYMDEAVTCGYEVSALEPVEKYKDVDEIRNRRVSGRNVSSSGYGCSSGSDTQVNGNVAKKVMEQGVDEILHMKMLESIVDTEIPSTMVLATGDAAEAEYSSGFLKNVERALVRGWKVELIAWKESTSRFWRDKEFVGKWRGKFRIVYLDEFREDLLAIYADAD